MDHCIFLSEIYELIDYWLIYATEFNNSNWNNLIKTINLLLPSSDFELTWQQSSNQSGGNNCYIKIGEDDDNCILLGVIDGNQSLGYYIHENGSYTSQTRGTVNGSVNSYSEQKVTVSNGTIIYNTANLTLPSNSVSLDKILSQIVWKGKLKDMRVKTL